MSDLVYLLSLLKMSTGPSEAGDFYRVRRTVTVMVAILSAVGLIFVFRFRSGAALEFKLIALQHQLAVLRRQRSGRPRLSSLDRLLWVLLYRIFGPRSSTRDGPGEARNVVEWHRKGSRFYWRWRSRRPGRPRINPEIRNLIRRMSRADPLLRETRVFTGNCSSSASRSAKPRLGGGCPVVPRSPPRPGGAFCAIICPTSRRLTCLWLPPRRSGCSTLWQLHHRYARI